MSDFTGPGIERKTSRADRDVFNDYANRSLLFSFYIFCSNDIFMIKLTELREYSNQYKRMKLCMAKTEGFQAKLLTFNEPSWVLHQIRLNAEQVLIWSDEIDDIQPAHEFIDSYVINYGASAAIYRNEKKIWITDSSKYLKTLQLKPYTL